MREQVHKPTTQPAPKRMLQRACACGQHTSAGGECSACRKKRTVQTRLSINRPGDRFEREAERAARQVLVSPMPSATAPGAFPIQRMTRQTTDAGVLAPPSVDAALAAPGSRLEPALQNEMEQRFGFNFSGVRVHTGGTANQSAREMNALAYTTGQDVVFADGKFATGTLQGRQLLAHELTHVVQQSQGSPAIQRWADCTPARLSLQDCPPRDSGEEQTSRSSPMYFYGNFNDPGSGSRGALVANFAINSSTIKADLRTNPDWNDFLTAVGTSGTHWRLLGFSDCQGNEPVNMAIRQARADAVANAFPPALRPQIAAQAAAPIHDCLTENSNASQRTLNRSVAIVYDHTEIDFPDDRITGTTPTSVCGPDVTAQVAAAVSATGAAFAGWSSDEKEEAADALDSFSTAGCAWDIIDLHQFATSGTITRTYGPTCATQNTTPSCERTVQVGDQCYYAGSVNYVIFGKMFRLCADYYLSIPLINTGYARFTRSAMYDLITRYKSSSPNYRESVAWAYAGYDGWPSGGTPPPGDRSNCAPLCPTPYSGPAFRIQWEPNIDPYNCDLSQSIRVIRGN